jgi:hypothetical protein
MVRAAGLVDVAAADHHGYFADHHGYFDACGAAFVQALDPPAYIVQG